MAGLVALLLAVVVGAAGVGGGVIDTAGAAKAQRTGPRLVLADRAGDAGGASQLVVVQVASASDTHGQLQTFDRVDGGWRPATAPIPATIGMSGISPNHHEGDGTTPAGRFGLTEAFGNRADPGTRLPFRPVTVGDYWVSDPASALYNTWQRGPAAGRWGAAEALWESPTAYAWAVVIDYNRSPVVPGRGSAMFLHVDTGAPTHGCVAVAADDLLAIMRWLDPAESPAIVIGALA